MSVTIEDKRCDGFQKYLPFIRTEECKQKMKDDKEKKDAEIASMNNTKQVERTNLGSVPAASSVVAVPATSAVAVPATDVVAAPTKMGGWFSRGGKRKSKAKKSRRKNRKQRKSRKSRK